MTPRPVGIDSLGVALPKRFLELEELAEVRGVAPEKYTIGLGGLRMAVADDTEDAVALGATAVRRLLAQTGIDPKRIGMLVAGTESGVDHAKPVASFIQGALGLPRAMRVYDTKHACYGATAGVMAAADWLLASAGPDQVAIVVATDLSRYGLRTSGEPTQGGGAVAMLIAHDPRLLTLDVGASGVSSSHVFDFWRPLHRREALVDGHYSVDCYLEALSGAYAEWRRSDLGPLERIVFHMPFPKMAAKAHARLWEDEHAGTNGGDRAERARAAYERQTLPSLWLCREIGNAYTASLYLGLAGLLHEQADALAGRRIGLFSYGSGCTSEFFSGTVGAAPAAAIAEARIDELLDSRTRVSVEEYEWLRCPDDTYEPDTPLPGEVLYAGTTDERRLYVAG